MITLEDLEKGIFKKKLSLTKIVVDGVEFPVESSFLGYRGDFQLEVAITLERSGFSLFDAKHAKVPELCQSDFLITSKKYSSNEKTKVLLAPKSTPLLVNSTSSTRVTCAVVNGPNIGLDQRSVVFSAGKFCFQYAQFRSAFERFHDKSVEIGSRYLTGILSVEAESGQPISVEDAKEASILAARCLSFVRGCKVGVGNIAASEGADLSMQILGFSNYDLNFDFPSWYSAAHFNMLPEILGKFGAALNNEEHDSAVLYALEFYGASNVASYHNRELAIVSSYTALEILTHFMLREKAGWSSDLLGSRAKFADKLRAAAHFVGLSDDPMLGLEKLQSVSQRYSNIDGFEILARGRNSIVHAEKKFFLSGVELFELLQMAQWLCEVLLFTLVGYRGTMSDRRQMGGWKGDADGPVPTTRPLA